MDSKKILKCTLAALFTMLLRSVYSEFFGTENALLGLMTGIISYNLLTVDFTSDIKYNALTLTLLNLLLGVMSYLSGLSIILEVSINIIIIFMVSFIYMRRNQKIVSFSFLLLYITMCNNQIGFEALPRRLAALLVGITIIILFQITFNKNKFKKSSKALILNSIKNIMDEINNVIDNKYTTRENIIIDNKLRDILISIESRNKRKIHKDVNDRNYFNIVVVLERLNIIIKEVFTLNGVDKNVKDEYLKNIYSYLETIIEFIKGNTSIVEPCESTNSFIDKYIKDAYKYSFIYESIEIMKILNLSLSNINNKDTIILEVDTTQSLKNKSWLLTFRKDIADINSLRFTYSLRLAIAISFAMFLVNYFNIEYGSWMITSIFVVMQPYREDTLVKAKNRFKGTIIGAIFAILMFYIFPSVISSMIFITFLLFMYYYATNYYKQVMWMSMLVIGMGVLSSGIGIISISRVIFVAVGILIALIFNKIFLPYGIENSVKRLRRIYIEKLIEIFNETKKITYGKEDQREVLKLVLEGNLIEYNLIKNIDILNDNSKDASVYKISVILSDIRFLILEMYYSSNNDYVKDKDLSEKFRVKMIDKIEVELKEYL